MTDLEDAFRAFEDQYGLPATRLARISLRDDIWHIPRLNSIGEPISEARRDQLFRERLTDVRLVDSNGYIVIPFNTAVREVSPLTRNHKIQYLEAEYSGSNFGDPLGRIYLRMAGTGTVSPLQGDPLYYVLPERTAVINTFFNGVRKYEATAPDLYKSHRLQGRPYINSRWEIVINTVDELVNEDIDIRSLDDIRLYVHYSDFTGL